MLPSWREQDRDPIEKMSPEAERKLIEQYKEMTGPQAAARAVSGPASWEDTDVVSFEYNVPRMIGNWQLF
jgi:hypothetical protein